MYIFKCLRQLVNEIDILYSKDSNFWIIIFFLAQTKMSISFNLEDYKLTCETQENKLLMRM